MKGSAIIEENFEAEIDRENDRSKRTTPPDHPHPFNLPNPLQQRNTAIRNPAPAAAYRPIAEILSWSGFQRPTPRSFPGAGFRPFPRFRARVFLSWSGFRALWLQPRPEADRGDGILCIPLFKRVYAFRIAEILFAKGSRRSVSKLRSGSGFQRSPYSFTEAVFPDFTEILY
ncbi:MAG: hypothetical protein DRO04_00110 [Candidatus Iainarchaeum archaeon]|uniref:Uncharacterized protein n=1 Tax=Candidatus Iainarchaeum sp. TaxID=3101447 RepID=A0A497JJE7_9ARCH|nr:MAG: hypothetical protein DRO04_00110 [Candidatus Diapherotrites archaeon]